MHPKQFPTARNLRLARSQGSTRDDRTIADPRDGPKCPRPPRGRPGWSWLTGDRTPSRPGIQLLNSVIATGCRSRLVCASWRGLVGGSAVYREALFVRRYCFAVARRLLPRRFSGANVRLRNQRRRSCLTSIGSNARVRAIEGTSTSRAGHSRQSPSLPRAQALTEAMASWPVGPCARSLENPQLCLRVFLRWGAAAPHLRALVGTRSARALRVEHR